MVLTVDVSLYFVSKASEDTALFVIKTFFFIGVKSTSFTYVQQVDILLEERWEWKWVEKRPERENDRVE